jgi:hypothetical protein
MIESGGEVEAKPTQGLWFNRDITFVRDRTRCFAFFPTKRKPKRIPVQALFTSGQGRKCVVLRNLKEFSAFAAFGREICGCILSKEYRN